MTSLLAMLTLAYLSNSEIIIYQSVYFCAYQEQACVSSQEPVQVSAGELQEILSKVAAQPENFVGFVDESGTALQFFVDDIDSIWVEIPAPEKQGSFGTHIDEERMREIVGTLTSPYSNYKESLGMKFRAW